MKSYKSRKVLWNTLNSFEVPRSPSSLLKSILVFGSHLKALEVFQTLRSHIGGSLLKSLEVFEALKSAVSPLDEQTVICSKANTENESEDNFKD